MAKKKNVNRAVVRSKKDISNADENAKLIGVILLTILVVICHVFMTLATKV